jgi:hypothetical protein
MTSYRKFAPKVEAAMQSEIKAMLEAGVIEESKTTFGCRVLPPLVKEDSESGYRFCNDYSPINRSVVTAPYPLPAISLILQSLCATMFFARLDLKTGYW